MKQPYDFNYAPFGLHRGDEVLFTIGHPDDESMVGGAVEALRNSNITSHFFIATDGEASTYGDEAALRSYVRRSEAATALAKYGVRHISFGGLPDSGLLGEHMLALRQKIHSRLAKRQFAAVVTLGENGGDGHTDHIAVHTAALDSASESVQTNPQLRLFGLTRGVGDHYIQTDPAMILRRLAPHKTQYEIFLENGYQPAPGTIEQPGIRVSADTQRRLDPYWLNHRVEAFKEFDLLRTIGSLATDSQLVLAS